MRATDARTITAALGGRWTGNSGSACCPAHEDHSPSLSIADGAEGRLLLHCHAGCTFHEIRDALRARGIIAENGGFRPIGPICRAQREDIEKTNAAKRKRQVADLWKTAAPIARSPAERYLRGRGISCALPSTLRYQKECWHPTAMRCPAMISSIDIINIRTVAVHRIYLRDDGSGKASISPAKAMLGPAGGGAVHLSKSNGPLVVTEGIETGLSLLSGVFPRPASIWAALSAPGMKNLQLPATPSELVIAADGDPVGRAAAEALASRAHALGWRVSMLPAPEGFDWNDVLTGKVVRR
ncbi:hypothetical protein B6V72_02990 [Thioclava sp. F34-6]|uniref:DUF7146 domain-containing protein n=1 Tax=Thioclava sp. F34-6 TaxID=1973003 RepID=UPI000B53DA5F|nr:toprim domain-containing protein [Thioclava sp. F34-6]OWY15561.1 hypothetical protein B6V72_02990 [Thioclava sp. F34-6]